MNAMKHLYLSQPPLKRGAFYYFGFWGAMGMFMPFLNVYFQGNLGFSGRQIGLLAVCFPLMRLLIAIPVASLADRHQRRIQFLMASLTGFAALMLFGGIPQTFTLWLIFMPILALFFGPTVPLSDSIITRMASQHSLNFGAMRLWGSLSFAVVAAICGGFWDWLGVENMFWATGIILLPTIFLTLGLEETQEAESSKVTQTGSLRELFKDRGLIVLIVSSFLVGAALKMALAFEGMYIISLGGTQLFVGFMMGISAASEFPTMRYRDALVRRVSGPGSLLLGYILLGVAFWGYTLVQQPWMLFPLGILKGLGFGLFHTSTVQLADARAPQHLTSTVQSIVAASAFGLAPLVFAPIGGEIYDRLGPSAVYICACLLLCSAILLVGVTMSNGVFTDVRPDLKVARQT